MESADGNDLLQLLLRNIEAISKDPTFPIDVKTFDQAGIIVPKTLQGEQRLSLVRSLSDLLTTIQQDASPVIDLLLRFTADFTYADILAFGSDALPYVQGLAVGENMVGFNRLMLSLLEKATVRAADAAHVASMLDTMLALVRLWLCTSNTGIAEQASRLLLDLLRIDREVLAEPDVSFPSGGQGLVWKRIFGDRNVYATFYEACSLTGPPSLDISKAQRTLAQARLMGWLPAVGAMDWHAVSRSHHQDVESSYGVREGLVEFTALRMVDTTDDILMYRCLIDFYADLLRSTAPSGSRSSYVQDAQALRFLDAEGLHARTVAIYRQVPGSDPLESMFLYGPAANYIAVYASTYPDHFLASQLPQQVGERLVQALDLSAARWAHAESPKHDLHLISSLPRKSILFFRSPRLRHTNLLSLLPSRSTNADVLNTLATMFHGPSRPALDFTSSSPPINENKEYLSEATAARALYFNYLVENPRFWNDIATHADTVALKDVALAAINCLTSVITAHWAKQSDLPLPTNIATPDCGEFAILAPPALEHALPYLFKPPQTFANLVGGRGDSESAAYQIAAAKYDALKALHRRLTEQVEQQPGEGYEEILATLAKRLAEGPMSREGEVGGQIATMEL